MTFRVGIGYDVHRLEAGYDLCLGGIVIPHIAGTVGHSDGDVLIHAMCDALLGAAGLRDIGYFFPDNSDEFKNIDSKILLKLTFDLVNEKGFKVINIDSTVCLENPKISSFIPEMITRISTAIETEPDNVTIKATTTEKLGFTGREEGIIAMATVLLSK